VSDAPYEPTPVDDASDVLPPALDIGALTFGDVPDGDQFATPEPDAGRDKRKTWRERRAERNGARTKERPSRARVTRAVPRTKPGSLVQPLAQIYTTVGALLSPFDPVCGSAIIASADKCAQTLDTLAQQNDAVRRALLALTQTSAIGAVAIAHAPIALAVATHHVPAVATLQADIGTRVAEAFANTPQPTVPDDTQDGGTE
jgi:hypothetical protein